MTNKNLADKDDILDMVWNAAKRKRRSLPSLARRIIKLNEEAGELSEAFLGSTSKTNRKHKKWADVREEAVDTAIIALDIALTCHEAGDPKEDTIKWFKRKINKWLRRQQKL